MVIRLPFKAFDNKGRTVLQTGLVSPPWKEGRWQLLRTKTSGE